MLVILKAKLTKLDLNTKLTKVPQSQIDKSTSKPNCQKYLKKKLTKITLKAKIDKSTLKAKLAKVHQSQTDKSI